MMMKNVQSYANLDTARSKTSLSPINSQLDGNQMTTTQVRTKTTRRRETCGDCVLDSVTLKKSLLTFQINPHQLNLNDNKESQNKNLHHRLSPVFEVDDEDAYGTQHKTHENINLNGPTLQEDRLEHESIEERERELIPNESNSTIISEKSFENKSTQSLLTCKMLINENTRKSFAETSRCDSISYKNNVLFSIRQYIDFCRQEYDDAVGSTLKCQKLARSLMRTLDLMKSIAFSFCDLRVYLQHMTDLVAIYISCELICAREFKDKKALIANRITYVIYKHLKCAENEQVTRENILRAFVLMPKLYNEHEIVTSLFQQFIPESSALTQNELADKLYIQYLIVFYQWKELELKYKDQLHIIDFADRFMRPAKTLATNVTYAYHLPRYASRLHATRYILENLMFFEDLRNASIRDNCLLMEVEFTEKYDDVVTDSSSYTSNFADFVEDSKVEPVVSRVVKYEVPVVCCDVDLTLDEDEIGTNISDTQCKDDDKWLTEIKDEAIKLATSIETSSRLSLISARSSARESNIILTTTLSSTTTCAAIEMIDLVSDTEPEKESEHLGADEDNAAANEPELFSLDFESPEFVEHENYHEIEFDSDGYDNSIELPRFHGYIRTYGSSKEKHMCASLKPQSKSETCNTTKSNISDSYNNHHNSAYSERISIASIQSLNDRFSSQTLKEGGNNICTSDGESSDATIKYSVPRIVDSFSCREDSIHLRVTPIDLNVDCNQVEGSCDPDDAVNRFTDEQILANHYYETNNILNNRRTRFDRVSKGYSEAHFINNKIKFLQEHCSEPVTNTLLNSECVSEKLSMKKHVKFNDVPIGPTRCSKSNISKIAPRKPAINKIIKIPVPTPIPNVNKQRTSPALSNSSSVSSEKLRLLAEKEHREAITTVFSSYDVFKEPSKTTNNKPKTATKSKYASVNSVKISSKKSVTKSASKNATARNADKKLKQNKGALTSTSLSSDINLKAKLAQQNLKNNRKIEKSSRNAKLSFNSKKTDMKQVTFINNLLELQRKQLQQIHMKQKNKMLRDEKLFDHEQNARNGTKKYQSQQFKPNYKFQNPAIPFIKVGTALQPVVLKPNAAVNVYKPLDKRKETKANVITESTSTSSSATDIINFKRDVKVMSTNLGDGTPIQFTKNIKPTRALRVRLKRQNLNEMRTLQRLSPETLGSRMSTPKVNESIRTEIAGRKLLNNDDNVEGCQMSEESKLLCSYEKEAARLIAMENPSSMMQAIQLAGAEDIEKEKERKKKKQKQKQKPKEHQILESKIVTKELSNNSVIFNSNKKDSSSDWIDNNFIKSQKTVNIIKRLKEELNMSSSFENETNQKDNRASEELKSQTITKPVADNFSSIDSESKLSSNFDSDHENVTNSISGILRHKRMNQKIKRKSGSVRKSSSSMSKDFNENVKTQLSANEWSSTITHKKPKLMASVMPEVMSNDKMVFKANEVESAILVKNQLTELIDNEKCEFNADYQKEKLTVNEKTELMDSEQPELNDDERLILTTELKANEKTKLKSKKRPFTENKKRNTILVSHLISIKKQKLLSNEKKELPVNMQQQLAINNYAQLSDNAQPQSTTYEIKNIPLNEEALLPPTEISQLDLHDQPKLNDSGNQNFDIVNSITGCMVEFIPLADKEVLNDDICVSTTASTSKKQQDVISKEVATASNKLTLMANIAQKAKKEPFKVEFPVSAPHKSNFSSFEQCGDNNVTTVERELPELEALVEEFTENSSINSMTLLNLEETPTVPIYLFNGESRDVPTPPTENTVIERGTIKDKTDIDVISKINLIQSPSEHEVTSTQETEQQTVTPKRGKYFDEVSTALVQNNQVDTTNKNLPEHTYNYRKSRLRNYSLCLSNSETKMLNNECPHKRRRRQTIAAELTANAKKASNTIPTTTTKYVHTRRNSPTLWSPKLRAISPVPLTCITKPESKLSIAATPSFMDLISWTESKTKKSTLTSQRSDGTIVTHYNFSNEKAIQSKLQRKKKSNKAGELVSTNSLHTELLRKKKTLNYTTPVKERYARGHLKTTNLIERELLCKTTDQVMEIFKKTNGNRLIYKNSDTACSCTLSEHSLHTEELKLDDKNSKTMERPHSSHSSPQKLVGKNTGKNHVGSNSTKSTTTLKAKASEENVKKIAILSSHSTKLASGHKVKKMPTSSFDETKKKFVAVRKTAKSQK